MSATLEESRVLHVCWRCGVQNVMTKGRRCYDCANEKREEVSKDHPAEVTVMLRGDFRAECECGWWIDSFSFQTAMLEAARHRTVGKVCQGCARWIIEHDPANYQSAELYQKAAESAHKRGHGA